MENDDSIPMPSAPENEKLKRHDELRAYLQSLYGGVAFRYDEFHGGYCFPPHGMCPLESYMKIVDEFQQRLDEATREMVEVEKELKKCQLVPYSPHPLIVLSGRVDVSKAFAQREEQRREELFHKLGSAFAQKRKMEELLDYWKNKVRPASDDYMDEIKALFKEKQRLRVELLKEFGMHVRAW